MFGLVSLKISCMYLKGVFPDLSKYHWDHARRGVRLCSAAGIGRFCRTFNHLLPIAFQRPNQSLKGGTKQLFLCILFTLSLVAETSLSCSLGVPRRKRCKAIGSRAAWQFTIQSLHFGMAGGVLFVCRICIRALCVRYAL